jgi:hypothetical protein
MLCELGGLGVVAVQDRHITVIVSLDSRSTTAEIDNPHPGWKSAEGCRFRSVSFD